MEKAALEALHSAGGLEGEAFQGGSSDGGEDYESGSEASSDREGAAGLLAEASSSEDDASADGASDDDMDADLGSPGEPAAAQKAAPAKGGPSGERAEDFARAFAKIVGGGPGSRGGAGAGASAAATAAPAVAEAPILAASKSIAKRKAEEAEEQRTDREAKQLRLEMRQRGHAAPTRRGEDPTADAREKALQKVATRGVVRLFNAVAKAQKQLRAAADAGGSRGAKAARQGKASFLAELRGGGRPGEAVVPSGPGQALGGRPTVAAAQRRQQGGNDGSSDEGEAGWDVLQEGFTGLQGGNKMKDWDKQREESDGGEPGDSDVGGSDSGEDGW